MMRWTSVVGALSVIVVLSAIGCQRVADDRPAVAYVTNGVASFWILARAGVDRAADELDVRAETLMPSDASPTEQQRMVEDLLARGIDGIAISPIDPANQVALINRAAARTHVITHDSDAPGSDRRSYVGMDNYEAGRMAGELVKEALPAGGSLMIFVGRLEQDNARLRRQGLIDELMDRSPDPSRYDPPGPPIANERYTILGTRTDQFDFGRAKENAQDAIASHPNLDAMVGLFAYNPPICLEAIQEAGRLGDIQLIAFDEDTPTLDGIEAGHVHGTIVQDPYRYGYESIRILAHLARGDESVLPDGGFLNIPARKIRRDTVGAFRAELEERLDRGRDPAS